eukprot:scaffold141451_cov133-Phaeocystis_antarctica.AAC.1
MKHSAVPGSEPGSFTSFFRFARYLPATNGLSCQHDSFAFGRTAVRTLGVPAMHTGTPPSAAGKRTASAGSGTPRRVSSRSSSRRGTPDASSSAAAASSDQPTGGSSSSSAAGGLQSQSSRRRSPRLSEAGPSPGLARNVSPPFQHRLALSLPSPARPVPSPC